VMTIRSRLVWIGARLFARPPKKEPWDPYEILGIPRGEPMDFYMVDDERIIRAAFGADAVPRSARRP